MTGSSAMAVSPSSRLVFASAVLLLALLAMRAGGQPAVGDDQPGAPGISVTVAITEDGTATRLWTEGIAVAIGIDDARAAAREQIPLGKEAAAWIDVLETAMPDIVGRAGEISAIFGVMPIDAVVVVGNRASSDGFGWVPNHIGINVQAFVDTYGVPGSGAVDRMTRIVAHEYLHLLTYAAYPDHEERRATPMDRALWTMFFEGIGDYVSVSERWLPDEFGDPSSVARDTLAKLEPVLVERLERLAEADQSSERSLRAGISSGRFDQKWGSLPVALWLHRETVLCGETRTLRAVFRLERAAVLPLAGKHADPLLWQRIEALRPKAGAPGSVAIRSGTGCLADEVPERE